MADETDPQLTEEYGVQEAVQEQKREEENIEAIAQEEALEEEYANELENQRQQEFQATNALYEQSRSFLGPSLFKYLIILLIFALPNDILDALDFTGFGIIISWFISFFLSMATVIIMWFGDSELKRVQGHMGNIEKYQKTLAKNLTRVSAKLAKFAPKNPLMKVLVGSALEMIPIISLLPWSCISVAMAYQDERKTFKDMQEQSKALINISPEAIEMV